MFTAEEILGMQVEGANATKLIPVPEGEYPAHIREVTARDGISDKGNAWVAVNVTWEIDDEGVRAATSMERPTCRQSIFLDIAESGALDMSEGKNIGLGRLREAVGQNGEGSWGFGMLEGAAAVVRVEHSEGKNPGDIYANVVAVSAA